MTQLKLEILWIGQNRQVTEVGEPLLGFLKSQRAPLASGLIAYVMSFTLNVLQLTTVRVLTGSHGEWVNVFRPLVQVPGCERLEVFRRFPPSRSFAKLPGCMPENLFSLNSPT
jgi:hypothetical protein